MAGKGISLKDDNFDEKAARLQAEQDAEQAAARARMDAAGETAELAETMKGAQGRVLAAQTAEGRELLRRADVELIDQLLNPILEEQEIDAGETGAAILRRILESDDDTEVFQPPEAVSIADLSQRHLRVTDWRVNRSDFEEGPGGYLAIDAEDLESGEKYVIVTGYKRLVAQMVKARQRDLLPAEVYVRPGRMNKYNKVMYSFDARPPTAWRS